jgi:hypothetical protein
MKQSRSLMKAGRDGLRRGGSSGGGQRNDGAAPAAGPVSLELWEILGRFDQALSLVTVCRQSLAAKESADVGDEEEVLRQGIRLLREVHSELDRGAPRAANKRGRRQKQLVAETL